MVRTNIKLVKVDITLKNLQSKNFYDLKLTSYVT